MDRTLMVLVSGNGSTLGNLCAKIHHKKLNARIVCVVANKQSIGAKQVAHLWDIPYWILDPKVYPPKERWAATIRDLIRVYRPGLIVLAGFNQLFSIPPKYEERVVNVHPSLLPFHGGKGMYGDKVHEAVLKSDQHRTGCTVHLCNDKYDQGSVLWQEVVPVKTGDTVETLRKRVQSAERLVLPKVINNYLDILMAKNIY